MNIVSSLIPAQDSHRESLGGDKPSWKLFPPGQEEIWKKWSCTLASMGVSVTEGPAGNIGAR